VIIHVLHFAPLLLPAFLLAGFSKSSSSASEATTQQQVGAEGGGANSITNVAGAYGNTAQGEGSSVSHTLQGATVGGKNNAIVVNTTTEDPAVLEAAIQGNTVVTTNSLIAANAATQSALESNTTVSTSAIDAAAAAAAGSEQVSVDSLAAGVSYSANSDSLAEASLQAAENSEASNATALEGESAEYAAGLSQATGNAQTVADNAITGQAQPISQTALPTASQENGTSFNTWVTWLGIISAVLGIVWYLRQGKASS
jgi:hypothetical protein